MAFIETRINDNPVVFRARGGPGYSTDVVTVRSGFEVRNANWAYSLGSWQLGQRVVGQSDLDTITAFFHAMNGRAHGFRFKDWGDYQVAISAGLLGAGVGSGLAAYQLFKRYTASGQILDRKIRKPVSGAVNVLRNGGAVTVGVAAGNIAIDTTTGIITFVADSTQNVSAVTVGATTQVTLAAALAGLAIGGRLFLTGLGGTVGAALNGIAHAITNIVGAVYTLSTATTGLAYTSGGAGSKFPQPTDTLIWSGEFDVPVRFDADQFSYEISAERGANSLYELSDLPIKEIRA